MQHYTLIHSEIKQSMCYSRLIIYSCFSFSSHNAIDDDPGIEILKFLSESAICVKKTILLQFVHEIQRLRICCDIFFVMLL